MVTVVSEFGVRVRFDPDECYSWEIFDVESNRKIGWLRFDDDGMCVGAEIESTYQGKGIATSVIKYLVDNYRYEFYFWPPDGQTYDDGRHLSIEGAKLANSLVRKNLARWINTEPSIVEEDLYGY
jgi:hypothetical protein